MTLFGAFVPSLAILGIRVAVGADDVAPAIMPTFKRKWWYRADRLDARPTIWSLENRPEEWEANPVYWRGYAKHIPSEHYYSERGTMAAVCSCSYYKFQIGQQRRLAKAVKAFIARQTAITQHQYQNHFLGQ